MGNKFLPITPHSYNDPGRESYSVLNPFSCPESYFRISCVPGFFPHKQSSG